jgi:hypothetical protein
MKSLTTLLVIGAAALLALVAGCATTSTAGGSAQKKAALAQAGFKTHSITTDKQKQQVQALPQDRVSLVKHNGKKFYAYPDLANNQVYTGNRAQYRTYKQAQVAAAAQNSGINVDPDPTGVVINEFDGWGPGPLYNSDGY